MVSMSVKKKGFEGFNIEAELTQKETSGKSFCLEQSLGSLEEEGKCC